MQGYYGGDINEGDILIMNDSYIQGTHLHDVTAIGATFYEGELVSFGAARAHWNDIGAMDLGLTMSSINIYQEGLRLEPMRIMSRGSPIREWYDHLKVNTRLEGATIGDLGAQIAAIRTGERRFGSLCPRSTPIPTAPPARTFWSRHAKWTAQPSPPSRTARRAAKATSTMTAWARTP